MWGVLQGGTVFCANGSARNAVNTAVTLDEQRLSLASSSQSRRKITSMISLPLSMALRLSLLLSPLLTLTSRLTFVIWPASRRLRSTDLKALPYEIGKVEDVRTS